MRQDGLRGRLAVLSLFVVLASAWCMDLAAADTALETALLEGQWAKLGDIALTAEFLSNDGTISAGEPVLVRIELTNLSKETVQYASSNGHWVNPYLEIRDGQGQVVSAMPRPWVSYRGGYGALHLKPGQSRNAVWVITGWYQFKRPGEYTVHLELQDCSDRAKLLHGPADDLPVISQASIPVRVLSFHEERLRARCDELSKPMHSVTTGYGSLGPGVRGKALLSVRHDIALPYLQWMAEKWCNPCTCRAMRRIGTERAAKLVQDLADRDEKVGEAARKALRMSLEPSVWDVIP